MAQEATQKGREQVLEPEILPEDACFHERGASGECLEGLDEAVGSGAFKELRNGPGAAFHPQRRALALMVLPEAQRRIIRAVDDAVPGKLQSLGVAFGAGESDH